MTLKTYLKDATILSVYDFKNNETNFRVITSTIKSQECFVFITKSGNCYVTNDEPKNLDITFVEFVVMRNGLYSPSEILEMRQALKLNDDRTMH